MKNIFIAFVIVLAAIGACNPPQSTTGTSSDTATTDNRARDTSNMSRDTTPTQRDTSMNR